MPPKIEVVIPSRKREKIVGNAVRNFPDPIVCVDKVEEAAYRKALGPDVRILCHPSVKGLGPIRQWIMSNVEADAVFQCDDDVHTVIALPGRRGRLIRNPESVMQIVTNCALNAKEAGTICFFFLPKPDPRLWKPHTPFSLTSVYGGWVQGFWRDEFNRNIRYDPELSCKWNVDVSCKILKRYKFTWRDNRFSFKPGTHMTEPGGLAGLRTQADFDHDVRILRKRYGAAITIKTPSAKKKTGLLPECHVDVRALLGGKSGRAPAAAGRYIEPRNGDKTQARSRVRYLIETGALSDPNALPCADCGHSGDDKRHEYDHHKGYDADHHEDVEPVCTGCHRKRSLGRGEWRPTP